MFQTVCTLNYKRLVIITFRNPDYINLRFKLEDMYLSIAISTLPGGPVDLLYGTSLKWKDNRVDSYKRNK